MAELKTKATDASIEEYIESRANDEQKADCKNLMALLKRVTEERPQMWGPALSGTVSTNTPTRAEEQERCAELALPSEVRSWLSILLSKVLSKRRC